ncbi:MAG: acetyl hydrolase [Proteobacteria bacterium]|nr:MAG: acetyl hydrolase [Pseudomonadota bacterium]
MPFPLHPQTQAMLEKMASMNLVPPHTIPLAQAREQFAKARAPFLGPALEMGALADREIRGPGGPLRVRNYRPLNSHPKERLPVLVYFHGGGWVFGDLDSHDRLCRALSNLARCAILSIDYRLAPEHKFPAAVNDATTAIEYVAQNANELSINADQLAAGGDSAGGNLAAVAALMFRDQGKPLLKFQLLIYPVTDLAMDSASYTTLANGYTLTRERMEFFREAYLRGTRDIADWKASPLKAEDLSRLPPALVIAAGHDPLVDEGKAYADRLASAGVAVTYSLYYGVVHGFVTAAGAIDAGRTAIAEAAACLQRAFSSAS